MSEVNDRRVETLDAHPRLVLTGVRLAALRVEIRTDPVAIGLFEELKARAEFYLTQPLPAYHVEGRRLLAVSRRVVVHVVTFALLAQMTDDARYAAAARAEMLAAAAFVDWNPSHFLDAAEMAVALSLGLDWLHDFLSADDRTTIEQSLIEKALKPC
ncbi:MAG: hypothetical protein QM754_05195 [Tepidisphaeraceae bacterium]